MRPAPGSPRAAVPRWTAVLVVAAGVALVPVLPCSAAPPGSPATAAPSTTAPSTTPAPAAPAPPVPAPAALSEAAAGAGGTIAAVVLTAAGDVLTAAEPDRVLPTASLVKVLVVEELLRREAAGQTALTPADRDRMSAALISSDDGAMNALWTVHDGAALVAAAVQRHGLTGTGPPPVAGQWGLAPTTARDTAVVLSALARDRGVVGTTVMAWLTQVSPTAADGFDQAFGVLGAAGAAGAVAAKQGWMCCVGGQRHLHSAGVLPDGRVVVVLGEFPAATPWAAAVAALDRAAGALTAPPAPRRAPAG